jgi:uncharacterized membrane protein
MMEEVSVKIGENMKASWGLVKKHPMPLILGSFIGSILSSATCGLLGGPVWGGMAYMFLKARRGETPELGDLFKPMNKFLDLLVCAIVAWIGAVVCGIGALVTVPLFMHSIMLVVDKDMKMGDALKASMKAAKKDFGGHILFVLALGVLNIVGAIACGVGLLITIPISYGAMTLAYLDVFQGQQGQQAPQAPPQS